MTTPISSQQPDSNNSSLAALAAKAGASPPPTYIQTPDGKIYPRDTEYDPQTGENLTRKIAVQNGFTPMNLMFDPKDPQKPYMIKDSDLPTALKYGLQTQGQLDSQNSASLSNDKVNAGNTGYVPNKTSSLYSQFAEGSTLGTAPQLEAGVEALGKKLLGSSDSLSDLYNNDRKAYQSSVTAQENQNPITSMIGKGLGMGASAGATGLSDLGGIGIQGLAARTGINAGQAATQEGIESVNQGQPVGQSLKNAGEAGIGGAAGSVIGEGANLGLGLASKVLPNLINKDIPGSFSAGLVRNENYHDPEFLNQVNNNTATTQKDMTNVYNSIKNSIGQQQGGILRNTQVDNLNPSNLVNSLNSAKTQLTDLQSKTGLQTKKEAINFSLGKINDALDHLDKNPNSLQGLQDIKRDLQAPIHNSQGLPIEDYADMRQILNGPATRAQTLIENNTPVTKSFNPEDNSYNPNFGTSAIGNVNKGYADIYNASNPDDIFKNHFLNSNDLTDFGRGNGMTGATRQKWLNVQKLQNDLNNNPDLDQSIKDEMNKLVSNLPERARQATLASAVDEHSFKGGLNSGANYLGNKMSSLTPVAQSIRNAPYINPTVQKLMELSPQFRAQMTKALPSLGLGAGTQLGANQAQGK